MKMATEILKIDASWAEEFTKTSEQILMTPSVVSYYTIQSNIFHAIFQLFGLKYFQ